MCGNEQVVIFTPKMFNLKMLASSLRCQMKKSSCSFNMVKLTVNQWCFIIGMLDARMRIPDNIDPNWAIEVCKWSVTIAISSLPYIGKSKELYYVRKSAHGVDKCFKSSTMISSQSVWSIQFTATMEMGTFHLWGAIELSILDQFWQMRCQNHCDLISFFMLFSHLNND